MTDRTGTLPPNIAEIVQKGASSGLTSAEHQTLTQFLSMARGRISPADEQMLDALAQEPPIDASYSESGPGVGYSGETGLSNPWDIFKGLNPGYSETGGDPRTTPPSVAEQVNAALAAGAPDIPEFGPSGITMDNGLFLGEEGKRLPTVDIPRPGASQVGGSNSDEMPTNDPEGRLPPRRGDRKERRAEDWVAQSEQLRGARTNELSPDSAFAGISPDYLPALEQNPELAAQLIAKKRGGAGVMASSLSPRLQAILDMQNAGVLSRDKRLGGPPSSLDALQQAESVMNSLESGESIDPRWVTRRALRNARNTPTEEMFLGEGDPGDLNNIIMTTNGALLSARPFMRQESRDRLTALVQSAQDEYLLGVATGKINPDQMSYPNWLKTVKKAHRWIGKSPTPEEMRVAFSG